MELKDVEVLNNEEAVAETVEQAGELAEVVAEVTEKTGLTIGQKALIGGGIALAGYATYKVVKEYVIPGTKKLFSKFFKKDSDNATVEAAPEIVVEENTTDTTNVQ